MNLTQEQADLLNTDFGEEIEKEASVRAQAISECYNYGLEKIAAEVADKMDEEEKEEKKEEKEEHHEKKMDEESEKAAAELGAFIERGFFDGLRKLGSERHGDEMHYLVPYLQEKVAKGKAKAAVGAFEHAMNKIRSVGHGAKELAGKAKEHAAAGAQKVKEYHQTGAHQVSHGAKSMHGAFSAPKGKKMEHFGRGAKEFGKGVAHFTPHAAVVGGGGAYALSGKKEEHHEG
jgi:hypothetical protein